MAIAKRNAARRGFKHSFSAYMSWLVERDDAGEVQREHVADPPLLRVAESATTRVMHETLSPKQAAKYSGPARKRSRKNRPATK
jgi:hypothetical protein